MATFASRDGGARAARERRADGWPTARERGGMRTQAAAAVRARKNAWRASVRRFRYIFKHLNTFLQH
ncbi:MAG: hypothetical protein SOI38_00395 [Eggerthellaceae bacterium]|jgi:hypothetical protein